MAGRVLRCEDLSGGMLTFDDASGALAVYRLTREVAPTACGTIPVVEFLGDHEVR